MCESLGITPFLLWVTPLTKADWNLWLLFLHTDTGRLLYTRNFFSSLKTICNNKWSFHPRLMGERWFQIPTVIVPADKVLMWMDKKWKHWRLKQNIFYTGRSKSQICTTNETFHLLLRLNAHLLPLARHHRFCKLKAPLAMKHGEHWFSSCPWKQRIKGIEEEESTTDLWWKIFMLAR